MYIKGDGVSQDDTKGIAYLKKSAKNNHAKGQYYLGGMYYLGVGVKRHLKTAYDLTGLKKLLIMAMWMRSTICH